MRICGIDASTQRTGVALFVDDKLVEHRVIDCHRIKDGDKRIREMYSNIDALLNYLQPDLIVVEDTWQGKKILNVKTFKTLCRLAGGIWMWATLHNVDLQFVTPSAWRSAVGIPTGNIKREVLKDYAIKQVKKDYGFTATDDECEAILIGASGSLLFSDNSELFK